MVGNPANTNALIAMKNAPDLDPAQFTAMTRLDHNRAVARLAARTGATVGDVSRMTIWGNHSATQFPDIAHATVGGRPAPDLVDEAWVRGEFIPGVQQRGAEVIAARGAFERGFGGLRRALAHAGLGSGLPGRGLAQHGRPERRQLRIAEGLIYSYP